eukprot:TRINITY_DN6040_c0_g1_i2.p2 TRINITY_DN6040_c0_g1~~TRINITY_DN6040_c0_g1_i2.p2  ORF type:complete len:130 (-),score=35.92 TRINITY_DN6040_c0_g1_i2:93-482(-)
MTCSQQTMSVIMGLTDHVLPVTSVQLPYAFFSALMGGFGSFCFFFFFLMIRRPPRSTHCISSAASDVYKRQAHKYYEGKMKRTLKKGLKAVSYTHLTLPTICSVQISVVAVSLKKKKKNKKSQSRPQER